MKPLGPIVSILFVLSCNDTNTQPQSQLESGYKIIVVENAGKVVEASSCPTTSYVYKQNGKREKIALRRECEQQQIKVAWCNRPSRQMDCYEAKLLVGTEEWGNWPFDLYLNEWKEYHYQYSIDFFDRLPYKVGDKITVGYLEDSAGKFVLERGIQVVKYFAPQPEAESVP